MTSSIMRYSDLLCRLRLAYGAAAANRRALSDRQSSAPFVRRRDIRKVGKAPRRSQAGRRRPPNPGSQGTRESSNVGIISDSKTQALRWRLWGKVQGTGFDPCRAEKRHYSAAARLGRTQPDLGKWQV